MKVSWVRSSTSRWSVPDRRATKRNTARWCRSKSTPSAPAWPPAQAARSSASVAAPPGSAISFSRSAKAPTFLVLMPLRTFRATLGAVRAALCPVRTRILTVGRPIRLLRLGLRAVDPELSAVRFDCRRVPCGFVRCQGDLVLLDGRTIGLVLGLVGLDVRFIGLKIRGAARWARRRSGLCEGGRRPQGEGGKDERALRGLHGQFPFLFSVLLPLAGLAPSGTHFGRPRSANLR